MPLKYNDEKGLRYMIIDKSGKKVLEFSAYNYNYSSEDEIYRAMSYRNAAFKLDLVKKYGPKVANFFPSFMNFYESNSDEFDNAVGEYAKNNENTFERVDCEIMAGLIEEFGMKCIKNIPADFFKNNPHFSIIAVASERHNGKMQSLIDKKTEDCNFAIQNTITKPASLMMQAMKKLVDSNDTDDDILKNTKDSISLIKKEKEKLAQVVKRHEAEISKLKNEYEKNFKIKEKYMQDYFSAISSEESAEKSID